MDVDLRGERPGDRDAVAALLREAFPGEPVDVLVDTLRAGATYEPDLALVATDTAATDGDAVLGFVMVTGIELETEPWQADQAPTRILCLSPLAVAEPARRRGIGRALVRAVLSRAGSRPEPYVVLEGDPHYYGRLGFVAGERFGLRPPSQRIPTGAFQAVTTHAGVTPRGRVLYSMPFWEVVTPGLAFDGVPWLDELERHARSMERAAAAPGALDVPVPACPGWTVGDVLQHLGVIHRVVVPWLRDGRRPRRVGTMPPGGDVIAWYATGWRELHAALGERPPTTPASTWSPWEATVGFWQRKQVHEHAIHALDVATALGAPWQVGDGVALDGIDEVVRLWLGTRLGTEAGGDGRLVRLVAEPPGTGSAGTGSAGAPSELWSVGLHSGIAELHRLEVEADAVVSSDPVTLYRWLWGRAGDDAVHVEGDHGAVGLLRAALDRALQ